MVREPLTPPVHFKNAQWAVTGYGIESLPPTQEYNLDAGSLADYGTGDRAGCYNAPVHMACKEWVDIELFLEAFRHGLYVHRDRYSGQLSFEAFHRAIEMARAEAAERSPKR